MFGPLNQLALGRAVKYTRENMKLPIADIEKDVRAGWWFGHRATTSKRGVKGRRVGLKN